MMTKKIAFLFLTLENPNFPKIWDKYFRSHKDKYSIYIHPKYPELLTCKKKNIKSPRNIFKTFSLFFLNNQ